MTPFSPAALSVESATMKQAISFTSPIASWRLHALILLLIALVACLPRVQAQSLEQTRRIMQSVVALQVSADPESPSS
ncbi:MAG: hypothetical protein EBX68_12170, partial [Betaproteobacteria bacterium]|nr:hypothetical protein [Betaproteobacteria bacterium]